MNEAWQYSSVVGMESSISQATVDPTLPLQSVKSAASVPIQCNPMQPPSSQLFGILKEHATREWFFDLLANSASTFTLMQTSAHSMDEKMIEIPTLQGHELDTLSS
jgi:hypothetical protein